MKKFLIFCFVCIASYCVASSYLSVLSEPTEYEMDTLAYSDWRDDAIEILEIVDSPEWYDDSIVWDDESVVWAGDSIASVDDFLWDNEDPYARVTEIKIVDDAFAAFPEMEEEEWTGVITETGSFLSFHEGEVEWNGNGVVTIHCENFDYTLELIETEDEDDDYFVISKGKAKDIVDLYLPRNVVIEGALFPVSGIKSGAFGGTTAPLAGVETLVFSSNILYVGSFAFTAAQDLKTVYLNNKLKNLSVHMFSYCEKLQSVHFWEDPVYSDPELEQIEDYAFCGCKSLGYFKIPMSVEKIGVAPWLKCSSVFLDSDGGRFSVCNDCLYSKDGYLIQYCTGNPQKTLYVPYGIEKISKAAFRGSEHLEKVIFPASLEGISSEAFEDCPKLKDVVFTNDIKYIDFFAFDNCPELKEVTLYGKPELSYNEFTGSKSFPEDVKVNIVSSGYPVQLPKSKEGELVAAFDMIKQLPFFTTLYLLPYDYHGYPDYLGRGELTGYGNSGPRPEVMRILDCIPSKYLEYEKYILYDEPADGDRVERVYYNGNKKNPIVLSFMAGTGSADTVVVLFRGGDGKKIEELMKEIREKAN